MNLLIILAAGEGTRLKPLTNEIPKCMIKISGMTMIDRLMKHFNIWADKIIVVTGYKSNILKEYLNSLNHSKKINVVDNPRYFETNSMYSAYLTKHFWENSDEIVFTNSDVIFSEDALLPFLSKESDITLAVDIKNCDLEDMRVSIDSVLDKVIRISKEIPLYLSHGEFTGVAKIKGEGINLFGSTIEDLLSNKLMEEKGWYDLVFDRISKEIRPLDYYSISAQSYCEIDTLEDLALARLKY